MLTKSEWEWLKTRDKKRLYCFYCNSFFGTSYCDTKCITGTCPVYPDMKDAAEFSERVALKLANYIETLGWKGCGKHALEQARLQVEEEMDGR